MKKVLYFLAASAAALCTIACNKDLNSSAPVQDQEQASVREGDPCQLKVGISGGDLTKSTSITADDEAEVKLLQVYVFRGDALDAYAKVANSKEITVSCTAGDREIYALVNDIERPNVKTKTELLALTSSLTNTAEKGFAMIGSVSKTLPQANTVTIDVNRLASRVIIKKITRAFTSAGLAAQDLKVEKIWIQNVATDFNLGLTAAPTAWINKMSLDEDPYALVADNVGSTIDNNAAYDTQHTFFCYPNPTTDDSSDATWCARHTRLVVQVKLGTSDTYYYPITLPVLEYNKSYEIENLTLTRPGSDNPDVPVTFQDCTFDINIKPWTVVPVTEGLTI